MNSKSYLPPHKSCQPFAMIWETTDYSIFKKMRGNRGVTTLRMKRMRESMEKKYLISIVIVNEKFEIIDGQGRFSIAQEKGLPIRFMVADKYGVDELRLYNLTMKLWSTEDTLTGNVDLGLKNYVKYAEFKDRFGFSHQTILSLLTDSYGPAKGAHKDEFKTGDLKVRKFGQAWDVAEKIERLAPYFKDYKNRSFLIGLMAAMNVKGFDLDSFIHKAKIQPTALKKCGSADQYRDMIEDVYNYKRKDKVNLKYAQVAKSKREEEYSNLN